jgi:hypothetical protein
MVTTMTQHETWCAAVIAENAMLPWRVRCDCKPKKPKEPNLLPLFERDEDPTVTDKLFETDETMRKVEDGR